MEARPGMAAGRSDGWLAGRPCPADRHATSGGSGPRRSLFRGSPPPATAAWKAGLIGEIVRRECGVPVMEIEVPPISDALEQLAPSHAVGGID